MENTVKRVGVAKRKAQCTLFDSIRSFLEVGSIFVQIPTGLLVWSDKPIVLFFFYYIIFVQAIRWLLIFFSFIMVLINHVGSLAFGWSEYSLMYMWIGLIHLILSPLHFFRLNWIILYKLYHILVIYLFFSLIKYLKHKFVIIITFFFVTEYKTVTLNQ